MHFWRERSVKGCSRRSTTITPTPADVALMAAIDGLYASQPGPPAFLVPIFKQAGRRYHIPWQVLAAINQIETDYGRDLAISSAGAVGWMQFMPATWRIYGSNASGLGPGDPFSPRDAIFAAARLLHDNGGRRHLRRAIFAYNHATWYVDVVLWTATRLAGGAVRPSSSVRVKLGTMDAVARLLSGEPYIWGGGHGGWGTSAGYDCSGFVSAVLHAGGYLTEPVTTQALPSQPGILPGPGQYVTILDRTDGATTSEDHVIIDLDGQWWESGGSSDGGMPGVHPLAAPPVSYLATFNLVLHPTGL
jgi:Transglycosylase SLT domain